MATVFVTLWLVFCLNLNAQTRPTLDFSPNFIIFMIDDIEYTSDWNYSSPSGTILDNGKIIEQGSHKELIEAKGSYYETHELQLLETEQNKLE